MEKINLSDRLSAVADFVKKGEPILDIGSDHAYLPIYLVQQNLVPSAIAGEVVQGPYEKAIQQVALNQLEDQISIRLGNGFEVLKQVEEVGTTFICGMGGILISQIIEDGQIDHKISTNTRLVLQPNNNEISVRKKLQHHHFKIIFETIVEENKKLYEIIVAEPSEDSISYTEEELIFGPILLTERLPMFIKKWQKELDKNESILNQLEPSKNTEKIKEIETKIQQIKRVIT